MGFKSNREDNSVNLSNLFLQFILILLPQATFNDFLSTNEVFEARLQEKSPIWSSHRLIFSTGAM